VIKFWNEKLEGVEVVTKSAFLKALKAEVKVHPYILLFLTYTLCGREGIVNLSLTKGFLGNKPVVFFTSSKLFVCCFWRLIQMRSESERSI